MATETAKKTVTVTGWLGEIEVPLVRYHGSIAEAHGEYALVDECVHDDPSTQCFSRDSAGNEWGHSVLLSPETGKFLRCVRDQSWSLA